MAIIFARCLIEVSEDVASSSASELRQCVKDLVHFPARGVHLYKYYVDPGLDEETIEQYKQLFPDEDAVGST